jgi:hypothetical protein
MRNKTTQGLSNKKLLSFPKHDSLMNIQKIPPRTDIEFRFSLARSVSTAFFIRLRFPPDSSLAKIIKKCLMRFVMSRQNLVNEPILIVLKRGKTRCC